VADRPPGGQLASVDFELIPLKGALDAVRALDPGTTVTVTASPSKGIEPTVNLALELEAEGYRAVPHLSARLIESQRDLTAIIKRLDDGGVARVFVIGGDGEPRGSYVDAVGLLDNMAEVGHPFLEVGVAGYPEGHPQIPAGRLMDALIEKQGHASYVVTQMCFDPETIVGWVESAREAGVTLPVKVGVPGVVDPVRLLTVGTRIGVGDSLRYLSKNRRTVLRMARLGGFRPDHLVTGVAEHAHRLGIVGLHVYTFNQVEATVAWYREFAHR